MVQIANKHAGFRVLRFTEPGGLAVNSFGISEWLHNKLHDCRPVGQNVSVLTHF
jgi:hypothetical protein